MTILPPKFRDIAMGPLQARHGTQAAYSGQGNSMNRSLARELDLPLVCDNDSHFLLAGVDHSFSRTTAGSIRNRSERQIDD